MTKHKKRNSRLPLPSGIAALLLVIASGNTLNMVGCGTEVGNGFSGPGANPDDSNKKRTQNPANSADIPQEEKREDSLPSAIDNHGHPDTATPTGTESIPLDPTVLLAPCASPFSELLLGPVVLTSLPSDKIQATFANGEWTVKSNDETIGFAKPRADIGPFNIDASDGNKGVLEPGFQCSAVSVNENVTIEGLSGSQFTKRSVDLSRNGLTTKLSWYVQERSAGSGSRTLLRIEVTTDGGTKIFDAPVSNP